VAVFMAGPVGAEDRAAGEAQAVDRQAFRDAMSRVGSAVHVLTTDGRAGRGGATMTAVASVSDQPPTVLVCLNRGSSTNRLVHENRVFAVSTLPAGAEEIAETFAGRRGLSGAERFVAGHWDRLVTGAPVLAGARMALDCRVVDMMEVATHTVLIGAVIAVRVGGAGGSLIYLDRHYHTLDP
jgi:flavin reductase